MLLGFSGCTAQTLLAYWRALPIKKLVDDSALLKAMVHSRESNSAFLDLNSSSERIPF